MQMKLLLSATLLALPVAFPALAQANKQTEHATAWKLRLTEHIVGNRHLPIEGRGQTGHAKITFVIDRSGKLKSRTMVESTGSRQLDLAMLAIFDRAQPFPEPPSELTEDAFSFTVPIVFAGRHFQVPPYGLAASVPTPAFAASDALDAWRKTVTEHVWRNRVFPPEALGQKGDAGVTFVIDHSGKLISNALVESTGFPLLDAAALAMVERSAPFPKPPAEAPDDLQRMTVLMTFDGTSPGQPNGWSWAEDEAKIKTKLRGVCRGC